MEKALAYKSVTESAEVLLGPHPVVFQVIWEKGWFAKLHLNQEWMEDTDSFFFNLYKMVQSQGRRTHKCCDRY